MPIFKHGNRYRVIEQYDGKRRSKVCATMKEARRWSALLQIELGKSPDPSQATLADLIDLHLAAKARAVTTTEDYRYLLGKIPQWLKDWRVENVTPMMIDQAYKRLLTETWTVDAETAGPLSVHRLRRLHGIVRPAFDLAVRYGWIMVNPAVSIEPPAAPDSEVEAPDPAAVVAILARSDAKDADFGAALRVLASTGCRRGELCALKWDDIDLDTGTIIIRRSVSTVKEQPHVITDGKTGKKGHRTVAVGPSVCAVLKDVKKRQNELILAGKHGRAGWVFSHDGRDPWRSDYVTMTFGRLRGTVPKIDIHVHQLRHHVATVLIAAGMDIKTVSGRLGHSRIATTADMYASVVPARDREAADILERSQG